MKILVIEDTQRHQESARELLKDHDVTVISSNWDIIWELADEDQTSSYDAVLTDLLFEPHPEDKDQSVRAYGFVAVFLAALRKVKYIGVLSEDVHKNICGIVRRIEPKYECFKEESKPNFELNGSKVIFWSYGPDKPWDKLLASLLKN